MIDVLIADKFEQVGLDTLSSLGLNFEYESELNDFSLQEKLTSSSPKILVVRSTKINKQILDASSLKLIIRAGAGYDTIDIAYAKIKGIKVANCPGKNSAAVAELTLGLILAIDRKIPDNVQSLREGRWNKKGFSRANGLYGRTLGLVGFGKIAEEVAKRAKVFGLDILVFSHWLTPEAAEHLGVKLAKNLEEIACRSDIVSVHSALTNQTKHLIDENFFESMKHGAYFINTSRAELVDQFALEKALSQNKIFAGLDVFEDELASGEGFYSGNLKNFKNAYCTHHIGASTKQAQEAVALEVVKIIEHYIKDQTVLNEVIR